MKKQEHILLSYKRNHKGEFFEEAETRKVRSEKAAASKLAKRSESALRGTTDEETCDLQMEAYAETAYRAKKTAGNARTHAARLKQLQKNEDFL